MRTRLLKSATILALSAMSLASLAPLAQARSVSAIRGKDEANFADPTSRCNTAAMQSVNKQAVNQMLADIKGRHAESSEAAKLYAYKLDIIWDAMLQPYCGYGSRGMTAVKKSFDKSVARSRAAFLGETKDLVQAVSDTAGSD
jgi:hypothetical protein